MIKSFATQLANSNAHRKPREDNAARALKDPAAFAILLALAQNPNADGHVQAWWALEIVDDLNPDLVLPHLPELSRMMPKLTSDGAVRSASKICMTLCTHRLDKIPQDLRDSLRDSCLVWLTGEHKVAARAYAARALYEIGRGDRAFLVELREILEIGYPRYSAGYKAMARDLIKKIGKANR